jgi:hypothetical protein
MKNKVIIKIVVGCVLLAGSPLRSGASDVLYSGLTPLKELVAESPMIVYTSVDTNNLPTIHLTITEIWKGTNEISKTGVAVGTQISQQWPASDGPVPDGAVLFYQRALPSSESLRIGSEHYVRAGSFDDMTIQEFKTKFGL